MKTNTKSLLRGLGLLALISPTLALAHVGAGSTSGLMAGVMHPLTGLDHLAAMLAVGLWAAQLGGRALWMVPMAFVSLMSLSAALSIGGPSIPWFELGIPASVLVLGLLIATGVRMPVVAGGTLVGVFAVFHGHAHGTEMPATVSGLAYGMGFVAATILLHGCGIALGLMVRRFHAEPLARYVGGMMAAFGLYLCVA